MPCVNPDHHHVWPRTGTLVIQRCENRCGLCTGEAAMKDWKHAWFTRRHAESHVRSGDFPGLVIDAGWDAFNPTGRGFDAARGIKRKSSQRSLRTPLSQIDELDEEETEEETPKPQKAHRKSTAQKPNAPAGSGTNQRRQTKQSDVFPADAGVPAADNQLLPFDCQDGQPGCMVNFNDLAFPPELDPNDPIFSVTSKSAKKRGVQAAHPAPQDRADFKHQDVIAILQNIVEGKATGRDLPRAMRQYIVDIIGHKKMAEIIANGGKPKRARKGKKATKQESYTVCQPGSEPQHLSAEEFLSRLTYHDGQAYIYGQPLLNKPAPAAEDLPLANVTHDDVANEEEQKLTSFESIQAVALGRMFASNCGGDLFGQFDADLPAMAPDAIPTSYSPDEDLYSQKPHPQHVGDFIRKIQGLSPQTTVSEQYGDQSQVASSFVAGTGASPANTRTPSTDLGFSFDLDQLIQAGVPTAGEMAHMCDSAFGSFEHDVYGFRSFAEAPDPCPPVPQRPSPQQPYFNPVKVEPPPAWPTDTENDATADGMFVFTEPAGPDITSSPWRASANANVFFGLQQPYETQWATNQL